jgi:phosphoribosylamine--glycine ligase
MILQKKFGEASSNVVIEEFLQGIEISVFAISDGKSWKFFGSAKDYKRIGEGDTGLNTGGMGAISPVPFADENFMQKVKEKIAEPTFNGLKNEGHSFVGFLFIGLMNCNGEPYVVEYNVRMGDPETEAILPRLKTDIGELLEAMVQGNLEQMQLEFDQRTAVAVFLVSGGYPGNFEKGKEIEIIPFSDKSVHVFHAGTKEESGKILTSGGRVIAVTSLGENLDSALENSLQAAEKITFEGRYFRRDIGKDLLQFQKEHGRPN